MDRDEPPLTMLTGVSFAGITSGFCTPGFMMTALALLDDNPAQRVSTDPKSRKNPRTGRGSLRALFADELNPGAAAHAVTGYQPDHRQHE